MNAIGASGAAAGRSGQSPPVPAGSSAPTQPPPPREDGGVDQDDATTPSRGTGPGDWTAGDYPPPDVLTEYFDITGVPGQRDLVRQYKVHVPPSYRREEPMPLVFCFHGLGQDPNLFCLAGAELDRKSDEVGFILVMPLGYENSWNAGTCCGAARDEKLDDIALVRAIFAEVSRHVNVDRDRVYATGLSNGGYMSYRLACEAADLFTAVLSGAGAIGINEFPDKTSANPDLLNWSSDLAECAPSRPVSVLHIHGTADELIPYVLQAKSLTLMASKYGCASDPVPAPAPKSSGDTTCVSYPGCPAGIEVTGCSVEGGGHCWFGSADCGTGAGFIGMAFVGENSDTMINNEALVNLLRAH
jgi:polyhydroxybutyrate depolymerase